MLKKITWMHGVVFALAGFIIFILSMIFLFTKDWQNAELVSDNYYEEELAYQEVIDAKTNADNLPEKPVYIQSSEGIRLQFPQSHSVEGKRVNCHLFRTNDAKLDVRKDLFLDATHQLLIPAKVLVPGSYTLKIKWESQGKYYQIDYIVLWN